MRHWWVSCCEFSGSYLRSNELSLRARWLTVTNSQSISFQVGQKADCGPKQVSPLARKEANLTGHGHLSLLILDYSIVRRHSLVRLLIYEGGCVWACSVMAILLVMVVRFNSFRRFSFCNCVSIRQSKDEVYSGVCKDIRRLNRGIVCSHRSPILPLMQMVPPSSSHSYLKKWKVTTVTELNGSTSKSAEPACLLSLTLYRLRFFG